MSMWSLAHPGNGCGSGKTILRVGVSPVCRTERLGASGWVCLGRQEGSWAWGPHAWLPISAGWELEASSAACWLTGSMVRSRSLTFSWLTGWLLLSPGYFASEGHGFMLTVPVPLGGPTPSLQSGQLLTRAGQVCMGQVSEDVSIAWEWAVHGHEALGEVEPGVPGPGTENFRGPDAITGHSLTTSFLPIHSCFYNFSEGLRGALSPWSVNRHPVGQDSSPNWIRGQCHGGHRWAAR